MDPSTIMDQSYEISIVVMKEQLLEALTSRKEAVLPLALGIFNKLQNTQVNQKQFASIDDMNNENLEADICAREAKTLNDHIHQLEAILDEQTSPVMSSLKDITDFVSFHTADNAKERYSRISKSYAPNLSMDLIHEYNQRIDSTMREVSKARTYAENVEDDSSKLFEQMKNTRLYQRYQI